jgi:hypothetical protein
MISPAHYVVGPRTAEAGLLSSEIVMPVRKRTSRLPSRNLFEEDPYACPCLSLIYRIDEAPIEEISPVPRASDLDASLEESAFQDYLLSRELRASKLILGPAELRDPMSDSRPCSAPPRSTPLAIQVATKPIAMSGRPHSAHTRLASSPAANPPMTKRVKDSESFQNYADTIPAQEYSHIVQPSCTTPAHDTMMSAEESSSNIAKDVCVYQEQELHLRGEGMCFPALVRAASEGTLQKGPKSRNYHDVAYHFAGSHFQTTGIFLLCYS